MPLGKWTSEGQVKEKSSSCGREPTLKGRKCVGIFGEWRKDCVNVFFQTRWYRRKFSLPLMESLILFREGRLFIDPGSSRLKARRTGGDEDVQHPHGE